jgi:uncharacterized membrane protein
MTMPTIAKLSRGVSLLFDIVALFWFILPFWQAAAGTYEGGEAIIVCWFFGGLFVVVGLALFFCYRITRTGEASRIARTVIWVFVTIAGLAGSAMALRIVWCSIP